MDPIYHNFMYGFILSYKEQDGSTTLLLNPSGSKFRYHLKFPSFWIEEIATMHMHCVLYGVRTDISSDQARSMREKIAVFKLTEPEIVHQIYSTDDTNFPLVRRIRRHEPMEVDVTRSNLTVTNARSHVNIPCNKHIAATENDAYLVSRDRKEVYRLLNDHAYLDRMLRRKEFVNQNDETDDSHIITEVLKVPDLSETEHINHIVAGSAHLAVITTKGRVFTRGSNCFGELGRSGCMSSDDFVLVDQLQGQNIHRMACGTWHTVCITTEGKLFQWGKLSIDCETYEINPDPIDLTPDIPEEDKLITIWAESTITILFVKRPDVDVAGDRIEGEVYELILGHLIDDEEM